MAFEGYGMPSWFKMHIADPIPLLSKKGLLDG
jgi:hypothetical protein